MVEASLPGDGYSWQLVGGHPALDLANTVSWRLDPGRRVDRVVDFDQLVDWMGCALDDHFAGPFGTASQQEAVVVSVRDLRDAFIRLLDSHLAGDLLAGADLRAMEQAWRAAVVGGELTSSLPTRWQLTARAPEDLVHVLALLLGGFLSEADLGRLRRCDGAGCGWLFLDTTRNHSRRWCDPNDCGNRARVRRYAKSRSRP